MVERTVVNPWTWSEPYQFNQGEVIEGGQRVLYCAGQAALDADGAPQHVGDMKAQVALATENVEAVLRGAGMSMANVVRLNMYTTDVDSFVQNDGPLTERLRAAGIAPPGTLLGVARLWVPELLVELEATAVA